MNKKMEDMKSNTVGEIQKRQADSSGQMSQLEQEIMTLKSQLEETRQLNSQLKDKNAELESNFPITPSRKPPNVTRPCGGWKRSRRPKKRNWQSFLKK